MSRWQQRLFFLQENIPLYCNMEYGVNEFEFIFVGGCKMAKYDVYVVGMREEKFVDEFPGEDQFDMEPDENTRWLLFCETCNGAVKIIITLETAYSWCGSGWTTASLGKMHVDKVKTFGPATHLPKDRKIKIDGALYDWTEGLTFGRSNYKNTPFYGHYDYDDGIVNNVFEYSAEADDSYYPRGGVHINMEVFEKCKRTFPNRPIWIFYGESATGKSTLGNILSKDGKRVYETDSANNGQLPNTIWADIIIVGNKWKDITIDSVKKHLPKDSTIVNVAFNKE